MSIVYTRFHGKRVSKKWAVVLRHAETAGVHFTLNSGKRTLAEQWSLWRHYKRYGSPVAAFPSPTAPHVRLGRADHALDVDTADGGARELAQYLRHDPRHAHISFPVSGEPWHLEIRGSDLTRLWRRYR